MVDDLPTSYLSRRILRNCTLQLKCKPHAMSKQQMQDFVMCGQNQQYKKQLCKDSRKVPVTYDVKIAKAGFCKVQPKQQKKDSAS